MVTVGTNLLSAFRSGLPLFGSCLRGELRRGPRARAVFGGSCSGVWLQPDDPAARRDLGREAGQIVDSVLVLERAPPSDQEATPAVDAHMHPVFVRSC